jgi:hypothetical protein
MRSRSPPYKRSQVNREPERCREGFRRTKKYLLEESYVGVGEELRGRRNHF